MTWPVVALMAVRPTYTMPSLLITILADVVFSCTCHITAPVRPFTAASETWNCVTVVSTNRVMPLSSYPMVGSLAVPGKVVFQKTAPLIGIMAKRYDSNCEGGGIPGVHTPNTSWLEPITTLPCRMEGGQNIAGRAHAKVTLLIINDCELEFAAANRLCDVRDGFW